ncbi:PREDICTED: putative serine/threonine-protein kinase receptor-like, partial [Fragaria vesca subsp. vesca]
MDLLEICVRAIRRARAFALTFSNDPFQIFPGFNFPGLARIVEGTQNLENTLKVVGTRGYMSPEYAMGRIFSEKSDVYSFGVLILEIISGKKNASFCLYDQQLGFLAYAWNLWNEGRGLELVDEVLGDSYASSE